MSQVVIMKVCHFNLFLTINTGGSVSIHTSGHWGFPGASVKNLSWDLHLPVGLKTKIRKCLEAQNSALFTI